MNIEFFFVALAHLLLLLTIIVLSPILNSSKVNKFKTYKR